MHTCWQKSISQPLLGESFACLALEGLEDTMTSFLLKLMHVNSKKAGSTGYSAVLGQVWVIVRDTNSMLILLIIVYSFCDCAEMSWLITVFLLQKQVVASLADVQVVQ